MAERGRKLSVQGIIFSMKSYNIIIVKIYLKAIVSLTRSMNFEMSRQDMMESKRRAAQSTLKWLLFRVRKEVRFKARTVGKPLVTHIAFIWFFPSMGTQVTPKAPCLSKASETHRAFERLFTSVSSKMSSKAAILCESFQTHITLERLLAGVRATVNYKFTAVPERLVTK